MKKLLFLSVILILWACGSSSDAEEKEPELPDNFTILGTITGAENTALYLEALSQQGSIVVTQGRIDEKGNFLLKGNIPGMGIFQLRIGESSDKVIPLTLVPKDKVKINSSFVDFMIKPNVSGTEWSKVLNEYMVVIASFGAAQEKLNALKGKASEEDIMAKYLEYKKPLDEFAIGKMKEDPDNPFNIVLATSTTPTSGFKEWDPSNLDVLKLVATAFSRRYTDSPIAETMQNQVLQIESAYLEYKNGGAGSNSSVAPEISMKNPAGKTIKLSSLRGKIVLIDFWASWCGPCRRESPNVVRLYNQYKDKGFTVFSVSLDEDHDAWKKAIAADGLIWPNHVSDLLGWKTPMTQLYGIEGIPHTVLIDKEGKIIGTGLRGESLEQKLKEIFSK